MDLTNDLRSSIPDDSNLLLTKIKHLLSQEKSRVSGLALIRNYISHFTKDDLMQSVPALLTTLQHFLVLYGRSKIQNETCYAICAIFDALDSFPELSRVVGVSFINPVVNQIIGADYQWRIGAVKCLKAIMKYFHNLCGNFKNDIKKFLFKCLMTHSLEVKYVAAECYVWLSVCGSGGHQKSLHCDSWKDQMHSIVNTLHSYLNIIGQDLHGLDENVANHANDGEVLNLHVTTPGKTSYSTVCKNFDAVAECLHQMLSTPLPIAVKVPHRMIIHVVVRLVEISNFIVNKSATKSTFISIVPQFISFSMNILQTLIITLKMNLLPQASVISKLLIKALVVCWDDTQLKLHSHSFSKARVEIYDTLQCWMTVTGSACGFHKHFQNLLEEIGHDIKIKEETVKLVAPNANKKRKHKKNMYSFSDSNGETVATVGHMGNSRVCVAALEVLEKLLQSVGDILPGSAFKEIHDSITMSIHKVQRSSMVIPEPYSDAKCRLRLYAVLRACVICQNNQYAVSPSATIRFFLNGLRDQNFKVSQECQVALNACELIIHPRVPLLGLPHSFPSSQTASTHPQIFDPLSHPPTSFVQDRMVGLPDIHTNPHFGEQVFPVANPVSQEHIKHSTIEDDDEIQEMETVKRVKISHETSPSDMIYDNHVDSEDETIVLEENEDSCEVTKPEPVSQNAQCIFPPMPENKDVKTDINHKDDPSSEQDESDDDEAVIAMLVDASPDN